MAVIRLRELLGKRVLVTRESARELRAPLIDAFKEDMRTVEVDFADTDLLSPSFFDELLGIAAPRLNKTGPARELRLLAPPSDLSTFQSIADTYGLEIEKNKVGWTVRRKARRPGLLGR